MMSTLDKKPRDKSPTISTEDSAGDLHGAASRRIAEAALANLKRNLARKEQEDARREPELRRKALEAYGGRNRFYPPVAQARGIILLNRKPIQSPDGPTEAQMEAMRNIAGYHVEAGTREFGAWTRRMLDDAGEGVIPYLQDLYEHATMANDLSERLENEHKAGKVSDELYKAMKLKTAK
jgi:hypothetical protein